ncbi:MAG: S-layer homology domain-containing protein, partial [Syntrophomonas sp.]
LPEGKSKKTTSAFTDADQVAPWAKEAMTAFVNAGTISGNNGRLLPTATTNRAEMAQVLCNLLAK